MTKFTEKKHEMGMKNIEKKKQEYGLGQNNMRQQKMTRGVLTSMLYTGLFISLLIVVVFGLATAGIGG